MIEVKAVKESIRSWWDQLVPEKDKGVIAKNRKNNWFFLFSALAFFCLTMENKIGYAIGMVITMWIMFVIAGQVPSVWALVKNDSRKQKLFYALTTAGVCLGALRYFYQQAQKLPLPERFHPVFLAVSIVGAVAGFYFAYLCVVLFWRKLSGHIRNGNLLQGITRGDIITCAVIYVLLCALVIFAFTGSLAFSGSQMLYDRLVGIEFPVDIIYTSDSPALLKENVYFALTHGQNDLRQPLFAVFAAPLLGAPYLIASLSGSAIVEAIALNCAQLIMLLFANYMLARLLRLSPAKRIVFMILSSCTYGQLLFSLMMEQYIVAYFWLVFCVYQICEAGKPERMILWGAGGSLLTSLILLPAMSDKHPVKQFKDWFVDMVKCGLGFVGMMLVCCRFDVISILFYSVSELSNFTGKSVTLTDKVIQYTQFVKDCFAVPNAGLNLTFERYPTWQLEVPTALNWVGIGILGLCLISFLWNRKNRSSRVAAFWVVFSAVMLLILGWGTAENGLILYALYFGWAFLVLLFQLVEKLEGALRIRHMTVVCGIAAAAGLLAMNLPAILEMIRFAFEYYPA